MWKCAKCGEFSEDQFDSCWKCSTHKGDATITPEVLAAENPQPAKWRLAYRIFRGTFTSWTGLFDEATAFANELQPERLVNISHSEDDDDGVVVVWYWTNDDLEPPTQ